MITVESLYKYENFDLLLKRHFTTEQIESQSNILLLSDTIAYHLSSKNYTIVKSIFDVMASSEDKDFVELSPGITAIDSEVVEHFKKENNVDNDYYVFCGSRLAFAEAFGLNVYSPSVNQFIVAVYETMNCIKFIGPGRGNFVIFKPILEISKDIFNGIVASRKDFFINAKNAKHLVRILEQDCEYYVEIINNMVEQNKQLKLQIEQAEKKQYMTTQMTWR